MRVREIDQLSFLSNNETVLIIELLRKLRFKNLLNYIICIFLYIRKG